MKSWMIPGKVNLQARKLNISWAASRKQCDQQGKGGGPAPLLYSSSGVLQPVQAGPEKGQKSDQRDRTHLL